MDTLLAVFAILISLGSFFWQIWANYKNSKQTKAASAEANKTSKKLYELEKEFHKNEERSGEMRLLFIIQEYFMGFYNILENTKPGIISYKNDVISQKQYIAVCKKLEEDFRNLIENSAYLKILQKHPSINRIGIFLSFEVILLNNSGKKFQPNDALYYLLHDLYFILKSEYKGKDLYSSELAKDIEKGFNIIKKARPDGLRVF